MNISGGDDNLAYPVLDDEVRQPASSTQNLIPLDLSLVFPHIIVNKAHRRQCQLLIIENLSKSKLSLIPCAVNQHPPAISHRILP